MSFITIHFGDDQKLLFNLLCPTILLYENIKLRCKCEEKVVIDIADENGSLKILSERPPDQYASEYLQGRANYILLKVLKKADSSTGKEYSIFEPLLNNVSELYPELMSKVHDKKINPDVSLPVQSFMLPHQKSSLQTRTKSIPRGGTNPRSPAQRSGSIVGNSLLSSVPKMKSSARLSK
ncbi:hypothetical protein ABFA07_000403 [Porites harrisoni]